MGSVSVTSSLLSLLLILISLSLCYTEMWFSAWFAALIKSYLFMVNDGNDDKDDLINPGKYGLENTDNVYFPSLDKRVQTDRLGGWLIKPISALKEGVTVSKQKADTCRKDECGYKGMLNVGKLSEDDTVFILLHGNAKNRGASHRLAAYKIFQSLGYYTLTVDYRGYGDSIMSFPLNETTVVEDAKAAIKLVRDNVGEDAKLIIYGHSMGTGISSHAVAECLQEGVDRVDGIILDSPFHSFRGMFKTGIGAVLNYLFGLEGLFAEIDIQFDSPQWLQTLSIPVRVFHSELDPVTPMAGAKLLVEDVKNAGKENIDMVIWEEEGLGHIGISTTKTFPLEIKRFADMVHEKTSKL